MISTCIIIFQFSSQNGEKSGNISGNFTRKVIEILPKTKNQTEEQKNQLVEKIEFPVRKMAHFSIYTALGITSMGFINTYNMTRQKKIGIAFLIGFLYAISDEIHQVFSDGRTAKVLDVCIDSSGVTFGIFIILGIIMIDRKRYKIQQ